MCFIIHPKHQKVKIAKKDITCYKVVLPILKAYYYNKFKYTLNQLTPKVRLIKHKYINLILFSKDYRIRTQEINKGYHSFTSLHTAKLRMYTFFPVSIILKCTISKGTRYYYNPTEKEYVSATILPISIID